ncbi:MAG: sugar phosphate isomerase/epimerase family protein [Thermaceae bacterium]
MRFGFNPLNAGLAYTEAFRLASERGLFLEIPYDLHEAMPNLPSARALREMGLAYDVGFTLHLPFVDLNPASLIPLARSLAEDRLKRALDFGLELGAKLGVLHTGQVPLRHPLALQAAQEALEKTLSALLPLPFPVALENLALSPQDLLQGVEDLEKLFGSFPQYGFCLDVGHAFLELGPKGPFLYLEAFESRLIHFHLHDNLGIQDDHLPVGAGKMNWEVLKPLFERFSSTAALEVTGGEKGVHASLHHLMWPKPGNKTQPS